MDNKRQRGAAYGGASLAGFPSWSVSVIDACHTDEQRCYRMAVAVLIDRDDRGGGLTVHERFPAKIMGTVFGIVAMIAALGMALGPPVVGSLFDRLGGYGWLYIASSAIGIAAALIQAPLRAPRLRQNAGAIPSS